MRQVHDSQNPRRSQASQEAKAKRCGLPKRKRLGKYLGDAMQVGCFKPQEGDCLDSSQKQIYTQGEGGGEMFTGF